MKVICDRAALLDAINLVSGVVANRTPRPQLACVKLTASKEGGAGRLVLASTDAEVSLRLSTANVDVHQPGEALIPAQKLQQIVAAEENEPTLTLELEQDALHVRGADAKFKVFGFPPADFPAIPEFPAAGDKNAKTTLRVAAGELDALISRTLFATARENSRYAINGVLFKLVGKKLEMVATDGRRLALARGTADSSTGAGEQGASCIIPTKALALVVKLIEDPDDVVRIAILDNQALFAFGDPEAAPRAVLATSLVEGAFPPYEDVIPKDQDKKAVFDVQALRSGVRRAALLTNEESRGVKLKFTGGKGKSDSKLNLTSRAPEMGEADIDVEVASYDGEDIEIGFNPGFISDALKVVSDSQVVMELKAPNKPGLIKSGTDFVYVVMPVSLQ